MSDSDLSLVRLADLDDGALAEVYAPPSEPWLRVNFVSTLDGAAQGGDGLSKSINNPADKRVFHLLRRRADVLVVGAGTVRAEAYEPPTLPLVVVSRSGDVPPSVRGSDLVHVATCADSPGLARTREALGEDRVLVVGRDEVDLVALKAELAARGWRDQLCEGGPALFGSMLAAGVVDELCLTQTPRLVAGESLRIAAGVGVDVRLRLASLLEQDGTLLGRWLVDPDPGP
ncbi:dihydrofolate reductase family protein [Nocardioides piscis]|nr:dihydrofolate reductase family protein [Nocardioides piscis]